MAMAAEARMQAEVEEEENFGPQPLSRLEVWSSEVRVMEVRGMEVRGIEDRGMEIRAQMYGSQEWRSGVWRSGVRCMEVRDMDVRDQRMLRSPPSLSIIRLLVQSHEVDYGGRWKSAPWPLILGRSRVNVPQIL